MKTKTWPAMVAIAAAVWATSTMADSTAARCEFYAKGSDKLSKMIPCRFSQRQGWITIYTDDAEYDLEPLDDAPENYKDRDGRPVYRESGLGDQGQIFRFEDKSIFVFWDASALTPSTADDDNPTAPFTTADYDATILLNCRAAGEAEFRNCPAGILRMEGGQASVVVVSPGGEKFTLNFMKDYVNAANREVKATLDSDTWTVTVDDGEVYEVPVAAILGD